jgi:hypothetical protein
MTIVATGVDISTCTAGGCSGSASVSVSNSVGNLSFNWSNGATTQNLQNLCVGSYTVTVTDNGVANCTKTYTVSIRQAALMSVNVTGGSIPCVANSGTVTATVSGGASPYNYIWSNGATNRSLTGLPAGTYSVTVTDAGNCSAVGSRTITQNTNALNVTYTSTNVRCAGGNTGAIDLTVTGGQQPYTYRWYAPLSATTQDVNGLAGGTYTVMVSDAAGCNTVVSIVIQQPSTMTMTFTTTPAGGANNGTASVSVNGGVAPYTFQWSNGSTGQTTVGLAAGSYSVLVRDANGCEAIATVIISNTVGVQTLDNLLRFDLFPNPNDGRFAILVEWSQNQSAAIDIYAANGQMIEHHDIITSNYIHKPIDISHQADGVYFIILRTEKGALSKKIMINKD